MADKNDISTVKVQDTDGQFDLDLRRTKALADLHALLVGGSTTVGNSGVASSNLTPLSANAARKVFFIQNTGTAVITVQMGNARVDLKACSSNNDGTGGFLEDIFWKGAVAISSAGTPRYNFGELI